MSPLGGEQLGGRIVIVDVGLMASGTTQATDYPTITPDGNGLSGDGFVCAVKRATERLVSNGISVRIVDPGTNVSGAALGLDDTPSTLRGTLTVFARRADPAGVEDDLVFALGDSLVLCDHSADPVVLAAVSDILSLATGSNDVCEPGDLLQLIWQETGDVGSYDSDDSAVGTRPEFQILAWPFTTVSG
jgi:hypothetical protein